MVETFLWGFGGKNFDFGVLSIEYEEFDAEYSPRKVELAPLLESRPQISLLHT